MQKISIALNAVLLVAVGVLFFLVFSMKSQLNGGGAADSLAVVPLPKAEGKTMYINFDTLQVKYEYYLKIKKQLEGLEKANEIEIKNMYDKYQNTGMKYQQQIEAQTMTQEQYQAAQMELAQMQEEMRVREEKISENFYKKAEELNDQLMKKIEEYLTRKSKEHNYSYVLAYKKGSNLLFMNDSLDITKQVVSGLNAEFKATPAK